jgi:hypothetical protein
MTRPEPSDRPEPPKDWHQLLLAYADGCASDEERRAVEEYIQAHPEAAETLRELEALSPQQREFWEAVAPRTPDEAEWEPVRSAIQLALPKAEPKPTAPRSRIKIGFVAAVAFSLMLAFGLYLANRNQPKPPTDEFVQQAPPVVAPEPDPLAEFDVLPIATESDVMVSVVRGDRSPGFVACNHPVPEALELATAEDLEVVPRKEMHPATGWELSQPEPSTSPLLMNMRGK